MKKTLLIVTSFCFGILNANAQIIITTVDIAVPTKIVYKANDTMPTISIGAAGPGQTWNLTSVVPHTLDTSTVMPYSSAPNSAFSTANTVIEQQGPQNFYGYVLNTASSMTFLGGGGLVDIAGNGNPTQINQISTPAEILFNFPTAYNGSFTSNYETNAKFYFGQTIQGITIDSIHQKSTVQKSSLVDAWGTLTTPLAGGPYNVLRIKETKITNDTTKAFFFGGWNDIPGGITSDSVVTFSWWANGIGAALATATMDTAGLIGNFAWLTTIPFVGINESAINSSVSVYPNPASNQITIKFDAVPLLMNPAKQDVLIDIKNELGQSVKKAGINQLVNGKNEMIVDIADLPSGIYFVLIKKQNTTVNKKFIKQ